ncbi:MAG: helix-hairpin-helix domain-containing protein [Candidatus Sericytochromatia bacterium]
MHYPSWIFLTTCLTLVLTSGGLWLENQLQGEPQAVAEASQLSSQAISDYQVLITGAVVKPGIYRLPAESRVAQLIQQAGGALPEARLADVQFEKKLQPGEVVHIPQTENKPQEAVSPSETSVPSAPAVTSEKAATGQRIALNTASLHELEALPGVGPALAARILSYRQAHGPFRKPEDLLEVKGIGEKKLAKMRGGIQL